MKLLGFEDFTFQQLYENKYVTPGNVVNPQFGWCVIMAGGPGSGKGWCIANKLLLQGKHFDVDKFKQLYVTMQNKAMNDVANGAHKLDLKNPEDTQNIHAIIKNKNWKEKEREYFIKSTNIQERLPNIIFDITAKSNEDVMSILEFIKINNKLYNVALVWVATNRSVAMYNNFNPSRGRVVPESIFHEVHNSVNATMLNLVNTYRSYGIDEFWCIKNSTSTIAAMGFDNKDKPHGIPANNVLNVSTPSSGDIDEIKSTIGLYEPNPNNPINYMSFEEIQKIKREDQRKMNNFYKKNN